MTSIPKACVVVDPYSSGRYLLYELKDRGVNIICIRSSLKLGQFFLNSYYTHQDYFQATIDFEDLDSCVKAIKDLPYEILAVFAGSEPGVLVADKLAEALNMPCRNDTALTEARKDKAEMQEQLRRCGVPACKQLLSGDLEEILSWAQEGGSWPLVVKPCSSSGSDGVYFCKEESDLIRAYEQLIGTVTPNATINNQIVLQEFLAGTEYIVDTVSFEGKHLVVAMWGYTKRKGTPWNPNCIISEGNRLLAPSGEVQDKLADYAFKVLDAVGLKYGPCHTEIMMTARGPILVEVNARLHGLQGPHLIGLATGTSKAQYAVDAMMAEGNLFTKHYSSVETGRYLYPIKQHCNQFVLISPVEGYLERSISNNVYAMGLPSVVKVLPAVKKGEYLQQSCDLNSAAGYVLMVHKSSEQLEMDIAAIRDAEDRGDIYQVTEEPPVGTPEQSPSLSPGIPPVPPPQPGIPMAGRSPGIAMNVGMSPMDLGVGLSPMPQVGLSPGIMGRSPMLGHSFPKPMGNSSFGSPMISSSPQLASMEKMEELWISNGSFTNMTTDPGDLLGPIEPDTDEE